MICALAQIEAFLEYQLDFPDETANNLNKYINRKIKKKKINELEIQISKSFAGIF